MRRASRIPDGFAGPTEVPTVFAPVYVAPGFGPASSSGPRFRPGRKGPWLVINVSRTNEIRRISIGVARKLVPACLRRAGWVGIKSGRSGVTGREIKFPQPHQPLTSSQHRSWPESVPECSLELLQFRVSYRAETRLSPTA